MRKGHDRWKQVENNVYRRGKNFYVRFKFKGKSICQSIGPKRSSAAKVIAKIKTEIAENRFLDVRRGIEPVTFHQFGVRFREWSETNHKPKMALFTLCRMKQLDKFFRNKQLDEITPVMIEKYKTMRKNQDKAPDAKVGMEKDKDGRDRWYLEYTGRDGKTVKQTYGQDKEKAMARLAQCQVKISPATVNLDLAVLHMMFNKAKAWGVVHESPFALGIKKLKGERKRLRFLMPDEINKLIDSCEKPRLRQIVTLAVHTGMRKGEILGMRREYVNWQTGMISIPDSKNNEPRNIPMNDIVIETLKGIEDGGPYFFSNGDGEAIRDVKKAFHKALRKAGIEDFRFHDLRHTFASNLAMAGESVKTVQELLGHKDIKMTMRYAHLAPDYKRKAVKALAKMISEKPAPKVISLRTAEVQKGG